MEASSYFILFVILLAFLFEFTNGFHDASNSIATIVSTGVLTPLQAVFWAAFFNFIAFLIFKLAVATTIGTGIVSPSMMSPYLIFATLISAIVWNIITWYYGLPTSSSYALIGGLIGAAFAKGGISALKLYGLINVIEAIILSPLIGLAIGWGLTIFMTKLTKKYSEESKNQWFKRLQLLSSAFLSLTHGGNDAQKTMGIIAILLYSSSGQSDHFEVSYWVVISCYLVIALGTLSGGWRIVHTMGKKITNLNTLRGCCAETGAAMVIFTATNFGLPVSTTYIVTGAIAGVGISQSFWGTQWSIMKTIVLTWILTIPATALIAAMIVLISS